VVKAADGRTEAKPLFAVGQCPAMKQHHAGTLCSLSWCTFFFFLVIRPELTAT